MAIPSWVNPPNYLAAMSSGANLGLNVRQQGFNERMSIEQLRQDQVRQALAVEQLRAAERRAMESDRLRALQFQAQEQRLNREMDMDKNLTPWQEASIELRRKELEPRGMTPFQEKSIELRRQSLEGKLTDQQRAEKWILESEINALESEIARDPNGLNESVRPKLDSAKKRYREMFMAPEEVEAKRNVESGSSLIKSQFAMLPDEVKRSRLPEFQAALAAVESGAPALLPPTLTQSPAGGSIQQPIPNAPMTNRLPTPMGQAVLDAETAKLLLRQAGGDKNKARELAKARGFTF